MNQEFMFLDFEGLENHQEREELLMHLNSLTTNPDVEFPWDHEERQKSFTRGDETYLNVFAPPFKSSVLPHSYESRGSEKLQHTPCINNCSSNIYTSQYAIATISNSSDFSLKNVPHLRSYHSLPPLVPEINGNCSIPQYHHLGEVRSPEVLHVQTDVNYGQIPLDVGMTHDDVSNTDKTTMVSLNMTFPSNQTKSDFRLNPNVSIFVSQTTSYSNENEYARSVDAISCLVNNSACVYNDGDLKSDLNVEAMEFGTSSEINGLNHKMGDSDESNMPSSELNVSEKSIKTVSQISVETDYQHLTATTPRSFADVLKSKHDKRTPCPISTFGKSNIFQNENSDISVLQSNTGEKKASVEEDKLAIALGRHLIQWQIDFTNVSLQPRGLINRSNWCYINATLQALLACSPFYSLLRNLPIGMLVDRGMSSTPVIDSMVKLSYEFIQTKGEQEDLQMGVPFQPVTVYEMLGTLKSHCLKGLQEDAEEFLSYILNGMHEEMVMVIKNYEKQYRVNGIEEIKANSSADISDSEEEWQVIGAKQRGMVTRKVVEHKTPISDLLGGQIKSLLTTNGNKTSASVQPFFTLQLDIQSESVSSVEEALDQMTIREPVHGYTCARTKQEVEAYCRIMLQKLPPILILHLKRFVYNRNGGCKKIMKHTEYPIILELKKELLSPEAKKIKRPCSYKLFAVMYHDGVEALIGHYICDIYHRASKTWIRCDDRNITPITEAQVLSHSPPRVPYLLFYQVCDSVQEKVN